MPTVPNIPNILPIICFSNVIHTPNTNKITAIIPIGLNKFINPVISCTPFNPPYWFINIGSKLIMNAADKIIFFSHNHTPR